MKNKVQDHWKDDNVTSFAEGLQAFFTKGVDIKVKLTKRRARIIQDIIRENKHKTSSMAEKYGEQYAEDWCAVMQWLSNQIYKRWSAAELTQDQTPIKTFKKRL